MYERLLFLFVIMIPRSKKVRLQLIQSHQKSVFGGFQTEWKEARSIYITSSSREHWGNYFLDLELKSVVVECRLQLPVQERKWKQWHEMRSAVEWEWVKEAEAAVEVEGEDKENVTVLQSISVFDEWIDGLGLGLGLGWSWSVEDMVRVEMSTKYYVLVRVIRERQRGTNGVRDMVMIWWRCSWTTVVASVEERVSWQWQHWKKAKNFGHLKWGFGSRIHSQSQLYSKLSSKANIFS